MSARRTGRPPSSDSTATRNAILAASRELLSENGFERTTMRAIAGRAGVDAALIHHYFGNKRALTVEALRPDVDPTAVFRDTPLDAARPGRDFVRRALHLWDDDDAQRQRAIALLRIALTDEEVSERMVNFYVGVAHIALGDLVAAEDRDRRLVLVAGQMLSLVTMRYVFRRPEIADATVDELAEDVGPLIERLLKPDR